MPGVQPAVEDSELTGRGGVAIHANGGREEYNNFLLDGIDNNDQGVSRYVLQPSVDAIQEFKIPTNNYSAEYGRSMGGQINVITKSGTNQWSGFAYEYLRNRQLDARNFFEGSESQKYIRNQFGGGIGGPVIKDKTFFFASLDGLQERRGLSRGATVPSDLERSGDLSGLGKTIMDPFTQRPFPGNIIPAARINPLASKYLDLWPRTNLPGISGNFLGQPVARDEVWQGVGRLDHRFSDSDQITLRYGYGKRDLFEPFAEESTDVPGYGDYANDTGHNAMIQYQRVFSPAALNSLRLGLNRAVREILQQNYTTDVNKLWGVGYLPANPVDFGFPAVTMAGYSRAGDVTQLPILRPITTYQITDDFSLQHGPHSLRMGGEVRLLYLNGINDLLARGSMQFSGAFTNAGIGDLLLGFPTLNIQSKPDTVQTLRGQAYNVYLQDDWRVRPSFTVNLGLRYEYNTPYTDPYNRMSAFNPATGKVEQVGTGGTTRSGYSPDANNLAPRVGFAYMPQANTVIRGGYGLYFDSGLAVANSSLYFNPPYFTINVFFPTATSLLTLQNPFPSGGGITPPASLSTVSPDLTAGYLQHWNLNVQRELKGIGTVSIAYTGSKGTHLLRSRDINQPPPAPGEIQPRRPYPAYSNIFFAESGANSNFNSLQLSFNRSLSRGLSVLGAYQWSKSIDDTSAFLGNKPDPNFPQNSRDFTKERATSSFDIRHRATIAAVYQAQGHHWLAHDLEFSGILAVQGGQPLTPILRFERSNTGNTGGTFGSDRPDYTHPSALDNPTPQQWFDTGAFPLQAPFTFGNSGRNVIRGPGYASLDLSAGRRFPLAETLALTFQAQAFNILNHTNFDNPERFADEPSTFGQIFSAKAPRQIQLVLRLTF